MTALLDLWDDFCGAHAIAASGVPLFAADEVGVVETFGYGRNSRPMLRRAPAMRDKLIGTVQAVLAPASKYEGVLYMMHRTDPEGRVIPLYIGKAGRHGRLGAAVSANLENIERDEGKFARWGYNYAYHLGDLSAASLPGHNVPGTPKYARWAKALFQCAPSSAPALRFDVRFWCTAWGPAAIGIWREFKPCPLAFAEYLLIGVAGVLFPNDLLNEEGVNRVAATD
jgi:hypothetical protein